MGGRGGLGRLAIPQFSRTTERTLCQQSVRSIKSFGSCTVSLKPLQMKSSAIDSVPYGKRKSMREGKSIDL